MKNTQFQQAQDFKYKIPKNEKLNKEIHPENKEKDKETYNSN